MDWRSPGGIFVVESDDTNHPIQQMVSRCSGVFLLLSYIDPMSGFRAVPNAYAAGMVVFNVVPKVSPRATTLTATGSCSVAPHFQVLGQSPGNVGAGPTFVDVMPEADTNGAWVLQFPMPLVPSTAVLNCPDVPTTTVIPIVPSWLTAVRDVDGDVLAVADLSQPDLLEVFTRTGDPVPSREIHREPIGEGWSVVLHVPSSWPTPRVVAVGYESLGENANVDQVERVQAWAFAMSPSPFAAAEATEAADRAGAASP